MEVVDAGVARRPDVADRLTLADRAARALPGAQVGVEVLRPVVAAQPDRVAAETRRLEVARCPTRPPRGAYRPPPSCRRPGGCAHPTAPPPTCRRTPSNRQPGTTCRRRSAPAGAVAVARRVPVDGSVGADVWSPAGAAPAGSGARLDQRRRRIAGGRARRRRRDLRLARGLGVGRDLALPLAPLRGERGLHAFVVQALLLDLLEQHDLLLGPALELLVLLGGVLRLALLVLELLRVSRRAHDPPRRTRRASPPTNRWRRRRARRRRRRRSPPRRRRGAGSDRHRSSRTCGPPSPRDRSGTRPPRTPSAASSAFVDSISTAS